MSDGSNVQDRRRHPRLVVEDGAKNLTVELVGYGMTAVYDMSFSGAALAQPESKVVSNVDDLVQVKIATKIDQALVDAKVKRISSDVVAVEFQNTSREARIIIDSLVSDKIVGLNMKLVDPQHYAGKLDYQYWFHGPKETNLYLWWRDGQLQKAQLEMDTCSALYEMDSFLFENRPGLAEQGMALNNQQILRKAVSVVQAMDADNRALKDFQQVIIDHAQS